MSLLLKSKIDLVVNTPWEDKVVITSKPVVMTVTPKTPDDESQELRAKKKRVTVEQYLASQFGLEFYQFVYLHSLESEALDQPVLKDSELLLENRIKRINNTKIRLK